MLALCFQSVFVEPVQVISEVTAINHSCGFQSVYDCPFVCGIHVCFFYQCGVSWGSRSNLKSFSLAAFTHLFMKSLECRAQY